MWFRGIGGNLVILQAMKKGCVGSGVIEHIERQRRLLKIEYEEEKASFAEAVDRVGLSRLTARGRAWFPVRVARDYYNSLNQRVVELLRCDAGADEEEDHEFEYGRSVMLFTAGGDAGASPRHRFGGTVSYVDGNRMVVAVADDAYLPALEANGERAGVMLSFDETTYRAMFDALDCLAKAKSPLAELRDLVYSRRQTTELSCGDMGFSYLNESQQRGVNKVLRAREVAVLHGPPGTGKTTTLVEAVYETLRRESQVLVCAQSNMAVDWIAEKLTDRGVNVLRLGNPSRVNDKMLSFTYERRFESHPDYATLWSIRKALRELHGARRRGTEQWHQKVERLKSRAVELELRIKADIFGSAHVIASTLVGSASRLLEGMRFNTLFVDEAGQALEAACWIPMRRASRMILAGDHCQLPPTVKSYEAMRQGLGRSLMEVIADNHPECVTLLTMQYRMNSAIMRFSSDWFYSGSLVAAPEVGFRGILDYDTPIEWMDTSASVAEDDVAEGDGDEFRETVDGTTMGRVNKGEARFAVEALHRYIDKIGSARMLDERIDIGLISPYRAQVRYLRQLLRRESWATPLRRLISVNTVDGFQGQERDVIFISLVRSNAAGQIGFLNDLRRMNVAMTRARMKLVIIGDVPTLVSSNPFYRRLYDYVSALQTPGPDCTL